MKTRYILTIFLLVVSYLVQAQQLNTAEYFFDTDPGLGNGKEIVLNSASIDTTLTFDLTGVTPGLHTLFMRFKNSNGNWGLTYQSSLQVSSGAAGALNFSNAEYFFDKDPGVGNGKKITLTGTAIDTSLNLDVTGLQPGGHVLYMRFENSFNYWSINYQQNIFLPINGNLIKGLTYFIDTVKNSLSLPLNGTALLDTTMSIPIPDNGQNNRMLGLQLTSQNGLIGNAQLDSISLCNLYKPKAGFRVAQYGSTFTLIDTSKDNPTSKIRWLANNVLLDSSYTINYLFPSANIPGSVLISEVAGTGCRVDTSSQTLNMTGVEDYEPKVGSYNSDYTLTLYGGGFDTTLDIFLQKGDTIVHPYLKYTNDGETLIAVFDFHSFILSPGWPPGWDSYQLHVQYNNGYEYIGPLPVNLLFAYNGCYQASSMNAYTGAFTSGRCSPDVLEAIDSIEPFIATDLTGSTNFRVGEWNTLNLIVTNTGIKVAKEIPVYMVVPAYYDIDTTLWNIIGNYSNFHDSLSIILPLIDTIINGHHIQYNLVGLIVPILGPEESQAIPLRIRTTQSASDSIYFWAAQRYFGSPANYALGPCGGAAFDAVLGTIPVLGQISAAWDWGWSIGSAVTNLEFHLLYGDTWQPNNDFGSIALNTLGMLVSGASAGEFNTLTQQGLKTAVTNMGADKASTALASAGLGVLAGGIALTNDQNSSDPCFTLNQGKNMKKSSLKPKASIDPNNIYGNSDYDTARNYINNYSPQRYSVTFENNPTATANAQHVYITDTLDGTKFNFHSFQLSQFKIGNSTYSIPPYRITATKDVPLENRNNMKARFTASFDTLKGILQVDFFSIDTTGHVLPLDSLDGFLPPNTDGISGTGGVTYSLKVWNLNTLDTFSNKAYIYFDNNAPIATNTWLNTVDTTAPSTKIINIITVNDTTAKLVVQSSDIGSGYWYSSLYVKGPLDTSFHNLGITSADTILITGPIHSTFQFYTIGADNVSNMETKTSADVTYTFTNGPLPLLITKFSGQYLDGVDHLTTTVTNVVNVNTIQLEKSLDGNHFSFLGNMAVAPVISGTYNYNDPSPATGKNYYRLRIIDIDGNATFSNIVVLNNNSQAAITIFPNPTSNNLNINFKNCTPGKYHFILTDLVGRILQLKNAYLVDGNQTEIISLSGYAHGTYVLSVTDPLGNKVVNKKVLRE